MKKLIATLMLSASLFSVNTFAQETVSNSSVGNFYIGVHGGYNLGIAKRELGFFNQLINIHDFENGDERYESVLGSLGEGANFGINLGYMFNQNFGAELGVDYFSGSKTEAIRTEEDDPTYSYKQTISGKMIQLNPSVIVKAKMGKVSPYAKLGLAIGVAPEVSYNNDYRYSGTIDERDFEFKEGTPIGITGAAGLEFNIQPKMSIFAEIRSVNMSYAPNKASLTKFTDDGENILPELDVRNREFEFVDNYIDDDTDTQDDPRRMTRITYPFSNVGLNIGFKYTL